MNTLIGIILVSLCALAVAFIGWIVRKLKARNEPEYESEHEWNTAKFWDDKHS